MNATSAIALNVKRGTPAAAADLVKYLNVEKKYGVKVELWRALSDRVVQRAVTEARGRRHAASTGRSNRSFRNRRRSWGAYRASRAPTARRR